MRSDNNTITENCRTGVYIWPKAITEARQFFGISRSMRMFALAFEAMLLAACGETSTGPPPRGDWWTNTVKVTGQELPIPKKWIESEEGKIAHSLIPPTVGVGLPDLFDVKGNRIEFTKIAPKPLPKQMPFDFEIAKWKALLPWNESVSRQYWDHLCATESGEWIVKKVADVEGFYFARPVAKITTEQWENPFQFEAPTINGVFYLREDTATSRGAFFVTPPNISYRFVEEPRRDVKWQADIVEPYIRLQGYVPGVLFTDKAVGEPMQVTGIPVPTARYAYTWRGARRARDREHGIAGIEFFIYDRETLEVLAFRRTFMGSFKRSKFRWQPHCGQAASVGSADERLELLPLRTLATKETSTRPQYPLISITTGKWW